MPLNNPGGLDGPFIFTSASCAIHARIQAAGNSSGLIVAATVTKATGTAAIV